MKWEVEVELEMESSTRSEVFEEVIDCEGTLSGDGVRCRGDKRREREEGQEQGRWGGVLIRRGGR